MKTYDGYREPTLSVLKKFDVAVWSDVKVESTRGYFEGIILPRSETADERHIVLKQITGYNVGLRYDTITNIEEVGRREANYAIPEKAFPVDPDKPRIKLFGTGGTIASRLDYRTGAVIPAFSPGELYGSVPELADYCNLETETLFEVFSENMGPEQYKAVANAVARDIDQGFDGFVIGHGTDTMHHTAAALSYMLQDLPVPVVMVGSQRSSDRPSSDAALNLIHAVNAAASEMSEVMVCMFGPTSDEYGLLHRGTRVRKMHSSYRSTFRTLSDTPMAMVDKSGVTPIHDDFKTRDPSRTLRLNAVFDERVTIVYYYPNMQPDIIDMLVERGYKGIVIAGTGLGHVNKPLYPALERARDAGVSVAMTVQTLWGYAQMYVYETGRELMKLGVYPLANMLPEAAYVKLGWALGQTDDPAEVRKIMETPICRDITDGEPYNGYLCLQGGVPEVDQFIKLHRK
jgi:glutamyl-tRNA(Gln) amidotransferase subunit D